MIGIAGRGAAADEVPAPEDAPSGSSTSAIRVILATPALRWTAVITATLDLGFCAQFEPGLPAYAITALGVPARTSGTASAVNCLVIVVLRMAVVKWTARRLAPSLLVAVGSIWVLSWLLLAAASVVPVMAGTMFIVVVGGLRRRRDDVRPGPQPSDRQPRPLRHGRHHAGYLRGTPDRRVRGGSALGRRRPQCGSWLAVRGRARGHQPRRRIRGGKPGDGMPATLEELVVEVATGDLRASQAA